VPWISQASYRFLVAPATSNWERHSAHGASSESGFPVVERSHRLPLRLDPISASRMSAVFESNPWASSLSTVGTSPRIEASNKAISSAVFELDARCGICKRRMILGESHSQSHQMLKCVIPKLAQAVLNTPSTFHLSAFGNPQRNAPCTGSWKQRGHPLGQTIRS